MRQKKGKVLRHEVSRWRATGEKQRRKKTGSPRRRGAGRGEAPAREGKGRGEVRKAARAR